MLDEFSEVTPLPAAMAVFIDMQPGSVSVMRLSVTGTAAEFAKVTVQVTGPPDGSEMLLGATDFETVRVLVAGG